MSKNPLSKARKLNRGWGSWTWLCRKPSGIRILKNFAHQIRLDSITKTDELDVSSCLETNYSCRKHCSLAVVSCSEQEGTKRSRMVRIMVWRHYSINLARGVPQKCTRSTHLIPYSIGTLGLRVPLAYAILFLMLTRRNQCLGRYGTDETRGSNYAVMEDNPNTHDGVRLTS
jgi:hypothetical protein